MQGKDEQPNDIERSKTMQPNHHSNDRPATPVEADEATIAAAFEQQLAQAATTPALAAELRHAPPTLYRRFVSAYRDLLALSRARRRKLLRSLGMSLAAAALAFALALGGVPTAHAAGIPVGGTCTLVDAITAANTDSATGGCAAGSGADTITLAGGTYTLTSVNNISYGPNGLPLITSAITIAGNGATIARDASAPKFRILEVAGGGNLTLNDTTISGGEADSIRNFGLDFSGGGIFNDGTTTLSNSTISGNTARIRGGGINNRGTLTLTNSTASGNTTSFFGGGIYNSSTATLSNSTLSGNTSGSGGGGIFNLGTLTLSNSTLSGNTSGDQGGGVFNQGTTTLSNSTLSGNSSGNHGGGVFNKGTATLSNSTVSGNTSSTFGGGIYNSDGDTLTLERSLISGNTAVASGRELYNYNYYGFSGTVIAANYNLFGHSGESNAQGVRGFTPSGSDITATNDGTTPTTLASILNTTLANNGGPTFTHALVTGSPAVDAAPTGPATDQRGVVRPQGANFDIGAFELEPANQPPVCSNAHANPASLWPPNHQFVPISIQGVSDPDGDSVSLAVTSVFQDEAVNAPGSGNTAPDGQGVGTATAQVRAERTGGGDGRVYHIAFTATDGNGGSCTGTVLVGVPHNNKGTPVDGGALYDSTVAP